MNIINTISFVMRVFNVKLSFSKRIFQNIILLNIILFIATLNMGFSHPPILFNTPNAVSIPSNVITIASDWNIVPGTLLGYPRYKMWVDPVNDSNLWISFSTNGSVFGEYLSTDRGNSWSSFGNRHAWDYHHNMMGDNDNTLHVGSRDGPGATADYKRYTTSWQDPIVFDDYYGGEGTAHALPFGTDVFVIVRSSFGAGSDVFWHRSTNSGVSFNSSGKVATVSDPVWHRIGSCVVSGQPAVLIWDSETSYNTLKIFLWNGTSFESIANNTLRTDTANPLTRIFSVTQDTDGIIHAVWWDVVGGNNVLRHSNRTLAGNWSAATTIETIGNNESYPILTHKGTTLYCIYGYTTSYKGIFYRSWTLAVGVKLVVASVEIL